MEVIEKFWKDESGQSVVEYSLLMTLIAVASVLMLTMMGLSISRVFGVQQVTVENYTTWAVEKYRTKE